VNAAEAARLNNVLSCLQPVLSRRAGLALALHGEMGIGKTHAANSLLAAVTCRTYSVHSTAPLAELVRLLPRPARLPRWAEGPLQALARGEHSETGSIADALAALLAALSPVVLLLEDLHEVSSEILGLWQELADRVRRSRGVALIITCRSRPPEPFEGYPLEPLSAEDSTALLQQQLGSELPPEATAWIYAHAAGNPLFTLEYLRFLSRQGYLWNDGERWHWRKPERETLPNTLEALIERLLDSAVASPEVGAGLEARALLPLTVAPAVWAEVAGLSADALAEAQRALERWGILRGGAFSHPLFGEVVLHRLEPLRRRELARRALAALAGDPLAATAFIDDAGLEPEQAISLLRRASEAAQSRNDRLQAARLLVKAVGHASGAARAQLSLDAARALLDAGSPDVQALLEGALPQLEDPSEALLMLAEALAYQGRAPEMAEVLARLPQRVRESPAWLERYLRLLFISGAYAEVLEVWQSHPAFHQQASPSAIYRVAYALMDRGDLTAARALAEARLAQGGTDPYGRAELLDICAMVAHYQGAYEQADGLFTEVLDLFRKHAGGWDAVANTLRNRALNRLQLGQYRESLPDLAEALKHYAERSNGVFYAQTLTMLSDVHLELGEYERAEGVLCEALEVFERITPQPFLITCLANLVSLYADWQPPYGRLLASRYGERCLKYARELALPSYLAIAAGAAARAATLAGDPARGLELAEEAVHLAGQAGFYETMVKVRWAHALALEALGKSVEAQERLLAVLQAAEAQQMVAEANRIGLELDRLQGDITRAGKRLTWFEERGLMNGVNVARRYFPALAPEAATPDPAFGHTLRLEVLGPMRLVWPGKVEEVHGHKRRELLARLLEARLAGRTEVPQLELLDALYPDEPEDVARGALKQLIFQLRKSLGTGAILRTGSGYALGDIGSDAEDFLTTGQTRLWRGAYLEDAGQSEETMASALYHALHHKAADLLGKDPAEAARLGQLLLKADPYDAAALRLTIKALHACGQQRAVEQLYRQGRSQLAEVGEVLPERWTSFMAVPPA
jgi:DNA-binding SARP family transcriptional activator